MLEKIIPMVGNWTEGTWDHPALYLLILSKIYSYLKSKSFIKVRLQSSLWVDNFYNKMLGKMQCNCGNAIKDQYTLIGISHIWLTICFWRPSTLSSVLSSLSVWPLKKKKLNKKSKKHHTPSRSYSATRMLSQNTPKSLTKVSTSRHLSPQASESWFFQCHNFYKQWPPLKWDFSRSLRIYSGQFRGLLFNNHAIFEKVITAHQELAQYMALIKEQTLDTDSRTNQESSWADLSSHGRASLGAESLMFGSGPVQERTLPDGPLAACL